MNTITYGLFSLKDEKYRQFHSRLMPNIPIEKIIGVRTPALRKYAKEVAKGQDVYAFLQKLPHAYYEENNLHGALLGILYKDLENYIAQLERFLPYIDNWATCDMISPKVFKKNLPLVYEYVKKWIVSNNTYTVRFAIVTLLGYYLEDAFLPEMLELVAAVKSEEYYVKMAIAWYFSMALVKQYEKTIEYFKTPVLEPWTHNKAIQKAIESYQLDKETKEYLRTLKILKK